MKIWLLTIGEPVPINNGAKDRLYRTGYLTHYLAEHGHDVLWWTSTFDHFRKVHLFNRDTKILLSERIEIRLLHGCGYASNLSLRRILDHRRLASKFATSSRILPPPDIILCSFPTIELSLAAVTYGKLHKVPVVLDMRDMWPDIFVDHVPKPLRKLAALAAIPAFREAQNACKGATAITGITEEFVEWGLRKARRAKRLFDRSFPMGYLSKPPPAEEVAQAESYWNDCGMPNSDDAFMACFFGTLGRQLDLETIIRAAHKVRGAGKRIRFVLCGTGDRLDYFRNLAAQSPNIVFPGWVDAAQIHALMRRSLVGLDPLPERYDFLATINNKAIEYLSAGLPILSSPDRGVLSDLINKHQCGMSYPYGDADALAGILIRLYEDRLALQRLAKNAFRLFNTSFVAEKIYADMMEHLIAIAETHRH